MQPRRFHKYYTLDGLKPISDNLSPDYSAIAQSLGLDDVQTDTPLSKYWGALEGDDLAAAMIDRASRFHQWQQSNDLIAGMNLKLSYYHNEYRSSPTMKHTAVMEQFGSEGQFTYLSLNHLRSLLRTIISGVTQNPPSFKTVAINSDADAQEQAALYQSVLEFYARETRLSSKINKAVELGVVVDAGYIMVTWDPFATDGDTSANPGIWKGAPSVKVLNPWDVVYDVTKDSWDALDWIIVRVWEDREKVAAQFPEHYDAIMGSKLRGELNYDQTNGPTRYDLTQMTDISNDIQIFHLYHKDTMWMPNGRFVLALDNGTLLFESPSGLMYPKLPVERFVCEDMPDILLGHSPISELLGCQEAVNSIASAVQSNSNNFANQYIAVEYGSELSPRTLDNGQAVLSFPAGGKPPTGINLTAIPDVLVKHLQDLMHYMESLPSISSVSRGQSPGANATGSGMLFLSSQSNANQGSMAANFAQFAANVQTSLLHVLRIFGRNEKTIALMGKNTAARTIVLATELKDFDEVIVEAGNPIMQTPQGRIAMAQQLLQWGGVTPDQAMAVVNSGNLGSALDGAREQQYELASENEWLMAQEQILVSALDAHSAHVQFHTKLLSVPWLRKPSLAAKLGIKNAPEIMQGIMDHITEHMKYMGQNQTASVQTTAGQAPGEAQQAPNAVLGHSPMAGPNGAVAPSQGLPGAPPPGPDGQNNNPAPPQMPNQPSMPLAH